MRDSVVLAVKRHKLHVLRKQIQVFMIDRNFMRAVGIIELAGMINVQPVDVPMLLRVPGAVNGAGTAGV